MSTRNDHNPFTEEIAGQYFVGREEELRTLRLGLAGLRRKTSSHYYIAGVHGTGKTSFLAKLCEIAEADGFLTARPTLDAGLSARDHVSTILRSIVEALQRAYNKKRIKGNFLDDWDKGKASAIFQHPRLDGLESDRMRHDLESLRDLMVSAKMPGTVICIDEGQRIDPRALSALKNAIQQFSNYMIVISLRVIYETGSAIEAGRATLDEKSSEAEGDFGASRLFVTGLAMGAFDSDTEAAQCIKRRLANNVIRFDDDVIAAIGIITGRKPSDMISLASHLYQNAAQKHLKVVDVATLNETFRTVHRSKLWEVETVLGNFPGIVGTALRALASANKPSSPDAIGAIIYPNSPKDAQTVLAEGIKGHFDRVSKVAPFLKKIDESYYIADPVCAYALKQTQGAGEP